MDICSNEHEKNLLIFYKIQNKLEKLTFTSFSAENLEGRAKFFIDANHTAWWSFDGFAM